MKGGLGNGTSSNANDVPSRLDVLPPEAHGLAHQAAGPVALHRVADALAGSKAESAMGKLVGKQDQDDEAVFVASSLATDLLEAVF